MNTRRTTLGLGGLGLGVLVSVMTLTAASAGATAAPGQAAPCQGPRDEPGEAGRFARQAYEFEHRNSNRNVFRKSRHFHPAQNAFRASRHYRQKLAASADGYPVRTFVRFAEHRGDRTRERVFSYAHHGRRQGPPAYCIGPAWPARGSHAPAEPTPRRAPAPSAAPLAPHASSPSLATAPEVPTSPDREGIAGPTRPPEQAIMTTTRLADGTVRTVISSRPSARSLADAWAGLARGHHAGAAEVFLERVFDPETGPEATVGYALATALDGDRQTARVALERALAQHPDLLDEIALTTAMRRALEALIGEAPEKAMLAEKQAD